MRTHNISKGSDVFTWAILAHRVSHYEQGGHNLGGLIRDFIIGNFSKIMILVLSHWEMRIFLLRSGIWIIDLWTISSKVHSYQLERYLWTDCVSSV